MDGFHMREEELNKGIKRKLSQLAKVLFSAPLALRCFIQMASAAPSSSSVLILQQPGVAEVQATRAYAGPGAGAWRFACRAGTGD